MKNEVNDLDAMINGTYQFEKPEEVDNEVAEPEVVETEKVDDDTKEETPDTTIKPAEEEEVDDLKTVEEVAEPNPVADTTDTKVEDDGKKPDTDGVDYKTFYEQITKAEFKANGKTVNGFTDPKKIIRSQQIAYGYNKEKQKFNKAKPYMEALKSNGLLDNPEKFDLMLQIANGDENALKKHLKDTKLDPFALDMEEAKYERKSELPTETDIVIQESLEEADTLSRATGETLRQTLSSLDDKSFADYMKNPNVRNNLLQSIHSGDYAIIKDKIDELENKDVDNELQGLSFAEKYQLAVNELQPAVEEPVQPPKVEKIDYTSRAKDIIRKQRQIQAEAKIKKEKEVEASKVKASRVSKPKKKIPVKHPDENVARDFIEGFFK